MTLINAGKYALLMSKTLINVGKQTVSVLIFPSRIKKLL